MDNITAPNILPGILIKAIVQKINLIREKNKKRKSKANLIESFVFLYLFPYFIPPLTHDVWEEFPKGFHFRLDVTKLLSWRIYFFYLSHVYLQVQSFLGKHTKSEVLAKSPSFFLGNVATS